MKKLVRDKIPQIVRNRNFKRCKENERVLLLAKKLCEESMEFLISLNIEELADVLEVLEELLKIYGKEKVELVKNRKKEERGGFHDCWVLED